MIIFQAAGVFTFIYLAGVLGERVRYDLRKKTFNHLAGSVADVLQQDARRLDHVARHQRHGAHRRTGDVGHAGRDGWGIVSIVTAFAFMLAINWQLALLVLLIIPVLLFVAAYFQAKDHRGVPQGAQDQ